jgi:hypothetical protein
MNALATPHAEKQPEDGDPPKDHPDKPGAQDGSPGADDAPAPFSPDSDDDSPLGDTDEHSDA